MVPGIEARFVATEIGKRSLSRVPVLVDFLSREVVSAPEDYREYITVKGKSSFTFRTYRKWYTTCTNIVGVDGVQVHKYSNGRIFQFLLVEMLRGQFSI